MVVSQKSADRLGVLGELRRLPTTFDPLHVWLGIPPVDQPADHYRLLGLRPFEDNADVIHSAAERQTAHLREVQGGQHVTVAANLMEQIAQAGICLLTPERKARYDAQLRASQRSPKRVMATPSERVTEVPLSRPDRSCTDRKRLRPFPMPPKPIEQKFPGHDAPIVSGDMPSYERLRRRRSWMDKAAGVVSTRVGLSILAGSLVLLFLSCATAAFVTLFMLRSPAGILVVVPEDGIAPNVVVQVSQDGKQVAAASAENDWRLALKSGTYELTVVGGESEFGLSTYRIRIERKGQKTVSLLRMPPSPDIRLPEVTPEDDEDGLGADLKKALAPAIQSSRPDVSRLEQVTPDDSGLDHVDNRQSLTALACNGDKIWGLIYLGPEKFVVLDNDTKKWRDTDQEKPRLAIARGAGAFSSPGGACFADGQLWVSGAYGDSIACIDTNTWEIVRRFPGKRRDIEPSQSYPGIAHDGEHLWVIWTFGNYDPEVKTRFLLKLDPQTGEELAEYALPEGPRGDGTHGLAWDGSSLWYIQQTTLSSIDPNNGRVKAQYTLKQVHRPSGLTWTGDALLIAEFSGKLWKLPFASEDSAAAKDSRNPAGVSVDIGGPGLVAAPKTTVADLTTHIRTAMASRPLLDEALEHSLAYHERRASATAYVEAMSKLAEVATFSEERTAGQREFLDAILAQAGESPEKRRILGILSRSRLLDTGREGVGIITVGKVKQIQKRGSLFETIIEIDSADSPRVSVYAAADPTGAFATGDSITLLGVIVDHPLRELRGYQGPAEPVVWGGYSRISSTAEDE